ncbi:TonB-dependent receptor [Desulfosoma sp.]|uniref:TonB-dependent receptor n=1 Tax=Desulfosoma sp. TaxID=2603217 RepID=UPI0040491001
MFLLVGPSAYALDNASKLEEIVVTATRTEKEVEGAPGAVSVVTQAEFSYRNVQKPDDIVVELPGVTVLRYPNSMGARITLRGFPDQKRTLVLLDGITLNDPYSGTVLFDGFYPEDLDRVEVVRGPLSNLYGGYAMGGVVHFITRMPEKREITAKAGYGSGFESGDAYDDLSRFYFSYGDKLGKQFSFLVRYAFQESNGYPTAFNVTTKPPPSEITGWQKTKTRTGDPAYLLGDLGDNTQWNDGILGKIQYRLTPETIFGFSFTRSRTEYDYDTPHTYLRDSLGNPVWSYKGRPENTFLPGGGGKVCNTYAFNVESPLVGELKTKAHVSFMDTEKSWYVNTFSGATRSGGAGSVSDTPSSNFLADIQFTFPFTHAPVPGLEQHFVTFGGAFNRAYAHSTEKNLPNWKKEEQTTSLRYESKGKDRGWALFFQDEIPLGSKVVAYVGARYDNWQTFDGFVLDIDSKTGNPKDGFPKKYGTRSHGTLSPKGALVYQPFPQTTLRSTVGKSFRPPTVYDLYRTWVASSGITYAANPELKPETALSWDLGWRQELWNGAAFSITYFENYLKDMIYRKTVSPTLQEHVNVGKAESRGVEAEIEQKMSAWLTLYGNLTYTDSEVTKNEAKPETEGKRLNNLPLWQGNVGARATKGPVRASVSGRYVGKRYNYDTNADKQNHVYGSYDPFWVTDVKVDYALRPWATVSLAVDNLFDRDYYLYYKAPGRSFYMELTMKF